MPEFSLLPIFILLLLFFINFLNQGGKSKNVLVFKVVSKAIIIMNTLGTCFNVERKLKVEGVGRGG